MENTRFKPCPNCLSYNIEKVRYDWNWGGAIGPILFSTVRCMNCGTQYNGKTGRSGGAGETIYRAFGLILVAVLLCVVLYFLLGLELSW